MRNISHKKNWNAGVVQLHVELPPIPLIKGKHNDKSDKYFLSIKFRRDLTSEKSGLYELKMALFNIGNPEDFLLFVHNFNTTFEASVTLQAGAKVQFLCTIVRGEVLHQFDLLFDNIESSTPLTLESIILGLGVYLFSCLCDVKEKARNLPRNEEAA